MNTTDRNRTKILISSKKFISLIFTLFIVSVIFIWSVWHYSVDTLEYEAIKMAKMGAAGISNQEIENLISKDFKEVEISEAYSRIKTSLIDIAKIDSHISFSYILLNQDNKIKIFADSESFDSKDYSPPGDYYFEASEDYFKVFTEKRPIITSPNTDRWGTWRSVLVPVFDKNKEVIACFGLDYDSNVWYEYAELQVIQALIISGTVALISVILYFFIYQNKELNEEKRNLIESERSKSVIINNLMGMAYRCKYDKEWTMEFVSGGCCGITGYLQQDLIYSRKISFNDIILEEDRKNVWDKWNEAIETKTNFRGEYRIKTPDGKLKWVYEQGQAVYDERENVKFLEGLIVDITETKEKEMKLKYITEHNTLTGLYNRPYFEQTLREEFRNISDEKRAIMLINVKNFNILNTTYGYFYAENIIKLLAKELETVTSDYIKLFHISIDRFILYVSKNSTPEILDELCIKINHLSNKFSDKNNIKLSVGVVELGKNYVGAEDLLKKASIAVDGSFCSISSRCCYFDSSMEKSILRKEAIKNELGNISRGSDNSGLFMLYQPIIDIQNNKIYGFEALARFKSKSFGAISPVEFIPIAEETQLIVPVGRIITRKSLEFLSDINKNIDPDIKMSVNVSGIQLLRDDFFEDLDKIITETDVIKSNIKIEITESFFVNDLDEINNRIMNLRKMDIAVAIDDFGTGYSSLSRESKLDVDFLKIDKSFIDTLITMPEEKSITSDIISMSHKLGHYVIAEGVEYESQKDYLYRNGCDFIQGYYFSKPLTPEDAIKYIKEF